MRWPPRVTRCAESQKVAYAEDEAAHQKQMPSAGGRYLKDAE